MNFAKVYRTFHTFTNRKITKNTITWHQMRYSHGGTTSATSESTATSRSSASVVRDVPGLSQACIKPSSGEVGPGASKTGNYKNPEYFSYHNGSFFEAEIEMAKYRIPQPSSKKQ